eukprot:gene7939-16265_t
MFRSLTIFVLLVSGSSWIRSSHSHRSRSTTPIMALLEVGSSSEIPEGDRKVVETSSGTIIVTQSGGQFYAVNAKCPHLGLPMKKGAITETPEGPTITCNFHNSAFSLSNGECKQWCQAVLGIPGTGFLAGVSGKFGGAANSPATVYPVTLNDGKVFIEI